MTNLPLFPSEREIVWTRPVDIVVFSILDQQALAVVAAVDTCSASQCCDFKAAGVVLYHL